MYYFKVELAEAQLNYIIGQTDTLLSSLNDPSSSFQILKNAEEPVINIGFDLLKLYIFENYQ